jgi:hypothetical protein
MGCELMLTCDTAAYPGVEIVVKNSAGEFINDDITAVIFEDNFRDTLMIYDVNELGEAISLAGAYERPGNYSLIITSDLYTTYTNTGIRVRNDRCHVRTRELSITLTLK